MSGESTQAAVPWQSYFPSSPSAPKRKRMAAGASQAASSPLDGSSASHTARLALERKLARDASRYALEPDGSMSALHPPAFDRYLDKEHPAHSDAVVADRKSAPPKSSPEELQRELTRRSKHAREPDSLARRPQSREIHSPKLNRYAEKAHSTHSDAVAADSMSAPPKSSPEALERELTRKSKHAREPLPRRPQSQATARSPKKQKLYCGNNAKARELLDGSERLGKPSECIQKGFGAALHQPVHDVAAFLRKFDQPYEKMIEPQLWYKNAEPPPGIQRATLPMAFQRGWGAGTAALARKLRKAHAEHARIAA